MTMTTQATLFDLAPVHHPRPRTPSATAAKPAAASRGAVQLACLLGTQDGHLDVNRSITSVDRRRGRPCDGEAAPAGERLSVPATRAPQPGQRWCSANPQLYLDVLSDPPTDARDVAAYEEALDTGRSICVQHCPFWVQCLTTALEGPRVDGFVAGTTGAEREALRDALEVTARVVHVEEYAPPVKNQPGAHFDHDRVWMARDRYPSLSRKELADRLNCSEATVKRVLGAPRPRPKDPIGAVAAYRASHPRAGGAEVSAATSLPVGVVEQIERQVREGVSEYALRDAYALAVFPPEDE